MVSADTADCVGNCGQNGFLDVVPLLLKSRGSITPGVNPDTPKVIFVSPKVILFINVLIFKHYGIGIEFDPEQQRLDRGRQG